MAGSLCKVFETLSLSSGLFSDGRCRIVDTDKDVYDLQYTQKGLTITHDGHTQYIKRCIKEDKTIIFWCMDGTSWSVDIYACLCF